MAVLAAACDGFGSLSGGLDEVWQEVKETSSYTVTFNASGGDPTPPRQTIPYGGKVSEPEKPGKTGNLFAEWYRDGTYLWDFKSDTVTRNITLVAKWDEVEEGYHVVRFSVMGAIPETWPEQQMVREGEYARRPDSPEKSDGKSILDKWYKEPGFANEWVFDVNKVEDSDIDLYGKWKDLVGDEQIVRFKALGGSPVPPDMAVNKGNILGIASPVVSKGGSNFGGWYSDSSCKTPWLFDEYKVEGTTNLYAQWNPADHYTVNFIPRGGTPEPPQQLVKKNEKVKEPGKPEGPEMPAKTGYTFMRWYWKYSGSDATWLFSDFVNEMTGNLILYADWQANKYTVKYDAHGGTKNDPTSIFADKLFTYDTEQNIPANTNVFTLKGHEFKGWNTDPDGNGVSISDSQTGVKNLSPVDGDTVTLYAQWQINKYNVTFDTQGGSSVSGIPNVNYNTAFAKPADPYKDYGDITAADFGAGLYRHRYEFKGWYKEAACTNVWNFTTDKIGDADLTLFAKWTDPEAISLSGSTASDKFASALTYVNTLANVGTYTIILDDNVTRAGVSSNNLTRSGTKLTLLGKSVDTTKRTISLSSTGSLFRLASGVTLVLGDKITLQGYGSNNNSVVYVSAGGTLIMNSGSKITGNTTSGDGGGVYVTGSGSTLTMSGGIISGNTASNYGGGVYVTGSGSVFTMSGVTIGGSTTADANTAGAGGGVYVATNGSFTMSSDAVISGNTVSSLGGGVYVGAGTFTMEGGTISSNQAPSSSHGGGGVNVDNAGTFDFKGGIITSNTASNSGGGVLARTNATFAMSGDALITDNSCYRGGGVSLGPNVTFTMSGGTISGNRGTTGGGVHMVGNVSNPARFFMNGGNISGAGNPEVNEASEGGGVYVGAYGEFTMSGNAAISGNKATTNGGGVYMGSNGSFTMSGDAAISGNKATGTTYGGGGVFVYGGTKVTMSGNAGISSNTATTYGGGVFVQSSGTLEMKGNAAISGNTATTSGGGVYVYIGTLTMEDNAAISGNTATTNNGGGVYMDGGTFTMTGGTIGGSGTADANTAVSGGGVYVIAAKFDLSGDAVINGNTATSNGGGVSVSTNGTFTMSGGAAISGNTASTSGGGVFVSNNGSFTMSGGTIGGSTTADANTAYRGGGVYVATGSFIMSGEASVSGNTTTNDGGGVYVDNSGTFTMNGQATIAGNSSSGSWGGGVAVGAGTFRFAGGTVYGSDAAAGLKNTADYAMTAALYISGTAASHGTFVGETWNSKGTLSSTANTITVVNGELQP